VCDDQIGNEMFQIFPAYRYIALGIGLCLATPVLAQQSERQRKLQTPAAICQFEGWSNETGEAGLPVRLTPEATGQVIFNLPPPVTRGLDEFAVTVEVVGWRPGWFKIESAAFPPHAYGPGTPKRSVFMGQGWVPSIAINAQLAGPALKATPTNGSRTIATLKGERTVGDAVVQMSPESVAVRQLLACRGTWVHVDTELGRGWVARVCAEQLGPCS
jgi:hypothetical protein